MDSLLSVRYASRGYFPSVNLIYGQLLSLLSVLLSISIAMLSIITSVDVVNDRKWSPIVTTIPVLTGFSVFVQLSLLLIVLVYTTIPSLSDYDTFLLTVCPTDTSVRTVVRYGATTVTNIREEDITVFYQRITRMSHSIPLTGWLFPGQILSLIIVFCLLCLHLSLEDNYTVSIVVIINLVQQIVQVIVTYLTSTDCGCCFPGVSIMRWFPHTDRYTQVRSEDR